MSNAYDVLYKPPKLHRKLKPAQEKLARAIVASGCMRLDADTESNFTRLLIPTDRLNLTFTLREITEPQLAQASLARIRKALEPLHPPAQARTLSLKYMEKVKADLAKRHPVPPKVELMMARALVSCNALPVIQLIHLEGAELYISYGHTVSDVMDVATWQDMGESNGLQAFGLGQNAIYVACGGHPFLDDDERTYMSDGYPAIARFMVIAAQETGHNADMIRDAHGNRIGRHSAIDWSRAPTPRAAAARKADAALTRTLEQKTRNFGINLIVEWERHLAFYHDNKLRNGRSIAAWLKSRIAWAVFTLILRLRGMGRLCTLPKTPYPATQLRKALRDMAFNLHPEHKDYHRADPQEHEAMLCIEALARVPQQCIKWGPKATSLCMSALYTLYYGEVVPACAATVQRHAAKTNLRKKTKP